MTKALRGDIMEVWNDGRGAPVTVSPDPLKSIRLGDRARHNQMLQIIEYIEDVSQGEVKTQATRLRRMFLENDLIMQGKY